MCTGTRLPPPTFTWLMSGWGPVTCALLRARTPRGLGYTLRREGRGPIPQALPPMSSTGRYTAEGPPIRNVTRVYRLGHHHSHALSWGR